MSRARQYKSQGHIVKATLSEILRLILRVYIQYLLSHKSDQMAMGITRTQSNASILKNSAMTSLGSASTGDKTGDTGQRPSHGSSIPKGNISSIGSAQQSSDILVNNDEIITTDTSIGNYNKSLAQKVSAGSKTTRNQTGNTSDRINNIIQPSNSAVSQIDKNLTDARGPSLELIGELWRLKQLQRSTSNPQF
jgi:hypothetical protein